MAQLIYRPDTEYVILFYNSKALHIQNANMGLHSNITYISNKVHDAIA